MVELEFFDRVVELINKNVIRNKDVLEKKECLDMLEMMVYIYNESNKN